jgi:hypothetical protein
VPPATTNITAGTTLTLVTVATGPPPLYFQWHFTDLGFITMPLTNATNATLVIPNFGATNEGVYTLEVTNIFGMTFSGGTTVQRIDASP